MSLKDKAPVILAAMQSLANYDITGAECAWCGDRVADDMFKDDLSRAEFEISHMCQKCQDETFIEEEGECTLEDDTCPHCGSGVCYETNGDFDLICSVTGKCV